MNAMQIADLRIENFRGIRMGHVRFAQRRPPARNELVAV